MPLPLPPTTPTGTGFPVATMDDPALLWVPITIATTTATTTTAGMIAPMMTGSGPLLGVALAIFLEASGRIWVVSFIRTDDDQGWTGCEVERRATRHRRRALHHAVSPMGIASGGRDG